MARFVRIPTRRGLAPVLGVVLSFGLLVAPAATAQQAPAGGSVDPLIPIPDDPTAAPQARPGAEPKPLPVEAVPARVPGPGRPEATRDPAARPAGGTPEPADDTGPLKGAGTRPGAAPAADDARGVAGDGYQIPVEKLPVGRQVAGLSVEVIAPKVVNLGHPTTIKLVARNTGTSDLTAVRVRYDLPEAMSLEAMPPDAKKVPGGGSALSWSLNTLAAGTEAVLPIQVKPIKVAIVDHATLVTVAVGGRAQTVIQKPDLVVEQTASQGVILVGKQVVFRITVMNKGTGPAQNVLVRAKLGSGLRADGEESREQVIPIIQPGYRHELEPLYVDTIAGGEQTCTVTASSDDLDPAAPIASATTAIVVQRPELRMEVKGPETRYTDTTADYKVVVSNPGTADLKDVKVSVTLPSTGGRLESKTTDATWSSSTGKLSWVVPLVRAARDPSQPGSVTKSFRVRLAGAGLYRVAAEARAGSLYDKGSVNTNVSGMADINVEVTERKRVFDVGEMTVFDIRIRNTGTKDARGLLVRAKTSDNIAVKNTAGNEQLAGTDKATGELVFPAIPSLAAGRDLDLSIQVEGLQPGVAFCKVSVVHDDLPEGSAKIEDSATTRVAGVATAVSK